MGYVQYFYRLAGSHAYAIPENLVHWHFR